MKRIAGYIWMALMLVSLCCACQHKSAGGDQEQDDSIVLFYLNPDGNGLTSVSREMDFSGDRLKDIGMVLDQLSRVDQDSNYEYLPVLDDEITCQGIELDEDGEISIDFGSGYNTMDSDREILCRAAVVKSLVQIQGVEAVLFTVDGQPLTNQEGLPVGLMRNDTFLLDNDKGEVYDYKETVTLYYASKDGHGLVEVNEEIETRDNQSMEEAVLQALFHYMGEDAQSPIPPELQFQRISVIQNVCYVDLNEEIYSTVSNVDEEIKVYAMVNTLTALSRITQVQFTINGEIVSDMNQVSGFDTLMECDYSYVDEE